MSRERLAGELRALGVRPGGVLLVHASFRALRPAAGSPDDVIDALRMAAGEAGTLVMPSWSGDREHPFDPAASPAARDLGVVAERFRRRAGVVRSRHPFAFAALGPRGRAMVADPIRFPPHGRASPVGRVREAGGQILLLGVGHEANTTVHLAELVAGVGYRRAKRVVVMEAGAPRRIDYGENDHCCERFRLADRWLRDAGLQAEGHVGSAFCRLTGSRDLVRIVAGRLARDPLVFLHPAAAGCAQCDEARASLAGQTKASGVSALRRAM